MIRIVESATTISLDDARKQKLRDVLERARSAIEADEFDGVFIGMVKRNLPGEGRGPYLTRSVYEGMSGLEAAGLAASMLRDTTSPSLGD